MGSGTRGWYPAASEGIVRAMTKGRRRSLPGRRPSSMAALVAVAITLGSLPLSARAASGLLATADLAPRVIQADERSATTAMRDRLDRRLAALSERFGYPGIAVAIRFPDGSMWVGTDGMADVATETPVTADTAFAIASVSKTFTAALILALAEDGELFLDSPVGSILPAVPIDPDITIRQMLDHTSGLHDYFFHPSIDAALLRAPDRHWERTDSLRFVSTPYFKPGQGFHYSNTNYLVLGAVAEEIGGAPLADQLRDRFLEPLGLRSTWYQPQEPPTAPVSVGYRFAGAGVEAAPISLSDGTPTMPFTSVVTAAAAAGGVASSAPDLVRWARALYGGDVLEPVSVAAMLDDVTRTAVYEPSVPYGLGVQRTDIDGYEALGHSGRLLGYRSVVRWLPGPDVTIAVLSNQSREDPANVARILLRAAIGPADPCACAERR